MPKPQNAEAIPATEVNRRFGSLIVDLLRGKSFTITRNGTPIARLIPVEAPVRNWRKSARKSTK